MSYRLLVASLVLLAGCQQAPLTSAAPGHARLVVTPDWGRTLQGLPRFTRADVNHLVVSLSQSINGTPTVIATQDLGAANLDHSLTFDNLNANTSYSLTAKAYRAAGTLNTDTIGTSTTATLTVGTDDAPTVATLPVTLRDGYSTSGVTTTLTGSMGQGFQDGGPGTAQFNTVGGLALAPNGDVIMADENNHAVRRVTPAGITSTVAGDGTTAVLDSPLHVAVDPSGNIFVDSTVGGGSRAIKKISAADGTISTFTTVSGSASALACDAQGNLYVASGDGLTRFTPGGASTLIESTVASATGLAVDADGTLYLGTNAGDLYSLPQGGTLSAPVATGAGLFGMAVDALRNVYFTDATAHQVKRLAPNGTISVVSGSGTGGTADDLLLDGGATAEFQTPDGIAVDADGALYVSDQSHDNLRRIL